MNYKLTLLLLFINLYPLAILGQDNKTQILVLGTMHLEQIEGFHPSMLDKVITKLDSFNFDAIGIEKMSGELLKDIQLRKDKVFDGIIKGSFGTEYLRLADTVQTVKKISFLEAEKKIDILLKQDSLNASDRKELIFNFLAATDIPSAALQFKYLNNISAFDSSFDKYVAEILEKKLVQKNEYYSLALRLARRENLNRLDPIDNFQDEPLLYKYYPEFGNDFETNSEKFSGITELPIFRKTEKITDESLTNQDLYNLYEFLNSNEYMIKDYKAQWEIWLKTNFSSGSDLGRYYLWEMRNLQIMANILNLVARNPKRKILIIIGASHKSFLEKYLSQIKDIEVLKYE